jgi:peptide/nickel transport system substrate-binding protein
VPATEVAPVEEAADLMALYAKDCDYGGIIKSIVAKDAHTVEFSMCKPDPAFAAKVAFEGFGIQPSEWIAENKGGGAMLEKPIGTGPWMLDTWARGDSITLKSNPDYYGTKAAYETLVIRWQTEGAARLLELQAGTVDMIRNVSPDDQATVADDANLVLIPEANPNIMYLGMTSTFEPFNDVKVRQAIAMGIDRQRIIDNYYPAGSEVASHFTPCSIVNGCAGDDWYEFDPEAAKALLAEAGFADGFATKLFYRDVTRVYLPQAPLVAVELQTQLKENLGIDVEIVVMESGDFLEKSSAGELDGFYMLGWGADYPHPTNFLDYHFAEANKQFGDVYPEIYEVLAEAATIGDTATAEPLYAQANNAIRELVPMVPIAHGASAGAALASVEGSHLRPFGAPFFNEMNPGKDTLIFMQNAEPVSMAAYDETDGETFSVYQQIVEPLLKYAKDSGETIPALAESCTPNADSTLWTCVLRQGVKFHDGSDFDANDVVATWSMGLSTQDPNHTGNTGVFEYWSYLWGLIEETGDGAMAEEPATEALGMLAAPDCDYGGIIKSITANDPLTVTFEMCKPDPAFAAKVAFEGFGIQPSEWIAENKGGGAMLEKPIGTGPWMLDTWARGDSITLKANPDYYGTKAAYETLVIRWQTESAARLLELQAGTVDMIRNVSPDDQATVADDANLVLIPEANPNIMYLGMTSTFEPFNDVKVRQAIAMGIDRQRIIDNYYPAGSEVASHFTPCSIVNGCAGDDWYEFDPEAAKALLAEAGFADGFATKLFYRDVTRVYLPQAALVAVEFQTQLKENLGIDVEIVVMESGDFLEKSSAGELDGFYMLGWGADYPHPTNFLDYHFAEANKQFGDVYPEIYEVLGEAATIGDTATAEPLYAQANNAIRDLVPMVPIAHGASAGAALASVEGSHLRPFGAPFFNEMNPGKDTLIFMQNAEPVSMAAYDETDGETFSVYQQIVEPLLKYAKDSGETIPALAESCTPNADSTVWVCKLRAGVKFHDGSDFDSMDVLATWTMGLDASSPTHTGNTGVFEYWSYLWGLINAPE